MVQENTPKKAFTLKQAPECCSSAAAGDVDFL